MPQLIIVPTPIGNIGDITLRAIEVLKEAEFILVEDTRVTGKLLKHLEVNGQMIAFHQHNEHKTLESVMDKLKGGAAMAFVSDAGTPGISDPGFLLVRECINNGIEVECLPGPTAFVPALVASGIPCDRFVFEGFLPVKKGRATRLEELSQERKTIVLYESPHRIGKALAQLSEALGADRNAAVCRELTKLHEEIKRGTLEELAQFYSQGTTKGEIVIVIEGKKK